MTTMRARISPTEAARRGPHAVFVYGTLMRGGSNAHWWPLRARRIQAASVHGALVDCGSFPGLIAGERVVRGEYWYFERAQLAAVLQRLDVLEDHHGRPGDLYHRAVLTCAVTSGATHKAWGYWYRGPSRPLVASNAAGEVIWK